MSFLKTTQAVVLSFAALAAGYTVAESTAAESTAAESTGAHGSSSAPAHLGHDAAMDHEMMDHGKMCDEEKMAGCCVKMHKKMCDEMMKEHSESMPCHDMMSEGEAG